MFRFFHPPELLRSWHFWLRSWIVWFFALLSAIIVHIPIIGKHFVVEQQSAEPRVTPLQTAYSAPGVAADFGSTAGPAENEADFARKEELLSPEEPVLRDLRESLRSPFAAEQGLAASLFARVGASASNLLESLPFRRNGVHIREKAD